MDVRNMYNLNLKWDKENKTFYRNWWKNV